MNYRSLILVVGVALTACSRTATEPQQPQQPQQPEPQYPATATVEHVDTYHGIDVADPYRWLEDDVRENAAVANWVDDENAVTFAYLDSIPERDLIKERLTELWDYERYGVPVKEGGRYFYSHNDGLQNQNVIYVQTSLDASAELLIDPNAWSDDGTVAMAYYSPSPDGKHVAYLVQDGGSDWRKGTFSKSTPARCSRKNSTGSSSRACRGQRTVRASTTAAILRRVTRRSSSR